MERSQAEVLRPADDVYVWVEQESSIHLKAATRFGDPVELNAEEARAIAKTLLELAARLKATDTSP